MSLLAHLFDHYANLSPGSGYWLEDAETETYCLKCVKRLAKGRDYSGYGGAAEQDGCLHCDKCGELLDYTLTDYGAAEELAHFKTITFRRNKPLDRNTAYHLARLIWARDYDMEVIRIAAKAIRCMRRIPHAQPKPSTSKRSIPHA
jgi:hypothetical protein